MFPSVVADIGGTNARFALVTGKIAGQYQFSDIHILPTSEHATFEGAFAHYLERLNAIKPIALCAAIAGPASGDWVKMTNLDWGFSCKAVAKQFGLKTMLAMNDFAAVAAAVNAVDRSGLISIKSGSGDGHGNKAVFGAGTGLGVAGVIHVDDKWIPLPSEGGHVNIAPANAFEADIIKAAMQRHGHVSAEVFISGPGLVNLYNALCDVKGLTPAALAPSDITQKALDGSCTLCRETLELFCSFTGGFAGNLALTYGATQGVYIAGGVIPYFADFLRASRFTERFTAKGPQSGFVKNIPVDLIVHPEIAFTGAAAWLEQHIQA